MTFRENPWCLPPPLLPSTCRSEDPNANEQHLGLSHSLCWFPASGTKISGLIDGEYSSIVQEGTPHMRILSDFPHNRSHPRRRTRLAFLLDIARARHGTHVAISIAPIAILARTRLAVPHGEKRAAVGSSGCGAFETPFALSQLSREPSPVS